MEIRGYFNLIYPWAKMRPAPSALWPTSLLPMSSSVGRPTAEPWALTNLQCSGAPYNTIKGRITIHFHFLHKVKAKTAIGSDLSRFIPSKTSVYVCMYVCVVFFCTFLRESMVGVSAVWMQLYSFGLASPHPSKTTTATGFPFGSFGWSANFQLKPELPICSFLIFFFL